MHGVRWVILVTCFVMAIFVLGSLLTSCSGNSDQVQGTSTPNATSSTPAITPSPLIASPSVAPKTSPTVQTAGATPTPASSPAQTRTPTASPLPNTTSADDLLYLADKQHGIPANYAPSDLVTLTTVRSTTAGQQFRRIALPSLEKLFADAKALGFELVVSSAYRSYAEQESVHAYWEKTLGKVEADRVSAEAGQSEHQLGTTADLTSASVGMELDEKFGTTPEGKWLADNAYRYGFVISYPEGKESVTGYSYEPWHIRYIGVEQATVVRQKGVTLNEYLRSRP